MNSNRKTGQDAEARAQRYLEQKGYRLLGKNVYIGHKELDLVMQAGAYIVFVEVKARTSSRYGMGREAVTKQKQQRLLIAAQAYLLHHAPHACARFDVVEVDLRTGTITHIENAFGL